MYILTKKIHNAFFSTRLWIFRVLRKYRKFVNGKYRGRDKIIREKISRALFLNFMSQFYVRVSKYRSMKNFISELLVFALVRGIQIFHIFYLIFFIFIPQISPLSLFFPILFLTLIDILHPICIICLQIPLFRLIIRIQQNFKGATLIIPTSPTC